MLSKEQKRKLVLEVSAALKNSPSIIFTDFAGLTMGEITSLRKDLKKQQAGYKVIKKSLLGLALKNSGQAPLEMTFLAGYKGPLAMAYGSDDGSIMAKTINNFSLSTKKLSILGGYLMGRVVEARNVISLAKLPPREILLTQIVQVLMSPISGLARVLDGISKKTR